MWTDMWKADQKQEKHELAIGKPKVDNVRKLWGIYFIDPKGGVRGEILETERKVGDTGGSGYAM